MCTWELFLVNPIGYSLTHFITYVTYLPSYRFLLNSITLHPYVCVEMYNIRDLPKAKADVFFLLYIDDQICKFLKMYKSNKPNNPQQFGSFPSFDELERKKQTTQQTKT